MIIITILQYFCDYHHWVVDMLLRLIKERLATNSVYDHYGYAPENNQMIIKTNSSLGHDDQHHDHDHAHDDQHQGHDHAHDGQHHDPDRAHGHQHHAHAHDHQHHDLGQAWATDV